MMGSCEEGNEHGFHKMRGISGLAELLKKDSVSYTLC